MPDKTFVHWLLLALAAAAAVLSEPDHARYAADVSRQLPLVGAVNGTDAQKCQLACESIVAAAGNDLIAHYDVIPASFTASLYAVQQREVVPLCIAEPQNAEGVSVAVKAVTKHKCPFAVRSGGHSIAPGTIGQHGGMVIDLRRLDQVDVSDDNSMVAIGPGNLWGRVYEKLEPLGLVVAGGRVDSVGVGGFTLGGGISFLSRRYGWSVDNVRNFEVVLPDGTITNANSKTNPDLYFALRGGGSSFGIVTRLDFEAHPHAEFWGGSDVNVFRNLAHIRSRLDISEPWSWSLRGALFVAMRLLHRGLDLFGYGSSIKDLAGGFATLASDLQTDESAHAYIFVSYLPDVAAYVLGTTYVYSRGEENPPALAPLTGHVPHMYTTRALHTLSELTREVTEMNPVDKRQYWRTATFKADAELVAHFADIFMQESAPVRLTVPDALISMNIQLMTKHEIALSRRNGGNAFGLKVDDGPLLLFSVTVSYEHAADDETIRAMAEKMHERIRVVGKEMGLYHPFVYPNYAAKGQDIFAGYAPESLERLLEIQARYDPGRVFANLQPEHLTLNDKRLK